MDVVSDHRKLGGGLPMSNKKTADQQEKRNRGWKVIVWFRKKK